MTSSVDAGDSTVIAGFPLDGPYTVNAARVRGAITARGENIYGDDDVVREILSLRGTVQPGNSGGPLLTTDGKVAGTIFARSTSQPQTGYASPTEKPGSSSGLVRMTPPRHRPGVAVSPESGKPWPPNQPGAS